MILCSCLARAGASRRSGSPGSPHDATQEEGAEVDLGVPDVPVPQYCLEGKPTVGTVQQAGLAQVHGVNVQKGI